MTLHPSFLIASAINYDGWVELPAVQDGVPYSFSRAFFGLDEKGAFVQRVVPNPAGPPPKNVGAAPLDMTLFGRCLCYRFGSLTPDLFTVLGYEKTGGLKGRLVHTDTASEEARRRVLRTAFLIYLAAYEERII